MKTTKAEEGGGREAREEKGEREEPRSLLVSSRRPPPPPLPAEISIPVSSAEKRRQGHVARQLAKELFDSSPRDPLK